MLSPVCANCRHQNSPQAHYCSHCGQPLHAHRIDAHYLWHEFQHGLLHVDKGILYTIKELTRRPGRMVREFLAGHRAAHFKPVGFLVIAAGLYSFLESFVHQHAASKHDQVLRTPVQLLARWTSTHMAWSWLMVLPLFAWFLWLAFRRRANFNYFESFTLLLYLVGQTFVFRLMLLPLRYLGESAVNFTLWANALYLLYGIVAMYQFFELEVSSRWQRIWRVVAAVLAGVSTVVLLVFLLFVISKILQRP